MPDWNEVVRKHLSVLKLSSPQFTQRVTQELSSHLEDSYEEHLQAGLTEEAAMQCALSEIQSSRRNWLVLRLLKEDHMTGFTKKVGLPGLLTFAVAMVIAWTLDVLHIPPKIIFLRDSMFLSLPIAWMCALPICGALGAFISRRNGGSRVDRAISASFPAAMFGVVFAFILIVGGIISVFVRDYWQWRFVVWGMMLWWAGYVILPAISLLLGAAVAEQANKIRRHAA
jgi:hypothetical protein